MLRLLSRLATTIVILHLSLTVDSIHAQSTPASADERAVMDVIEKLFAGMKSKDTVLLRSVFHPEGRLYGMRPGRNGPVVQVLPAAEFIAFVARDGRGPWIERGWNPQVTISGTLATVWAEYDFHMGATFSHCGIDAVQLLNTPEGWRIVSIADTYVKDGCERHPPPQL